MTIHSDCAQAATLAQLSFAYDALSHPIWMVSLDEELFFANRSWQKFINENNPIATGSSWLNWVCAEDRPAIAIAWSAARQSSSPFSATCRLLTKDDSCIWHQIQATIAEFPNGDGSTSKYWVFNCLNIHEQKVKEENLLEQLHTQSNMLNASIDCIKVVTPDGRLAAMNETGCIALGVASSSGFGMPWIPLLAPSCHADAAIALQQVIQGKAARFTGKSETGDGQLQHWDNLLTPYVDEQGQTKSILCVSRDITEHRMTEIALAASQERLELASEAAQLGSFDFWPARDQIWCDQRMRGLLDGRIAATSIFSRAFLSLIHPDDQAVLTSGLQQCMVSDQATQFDMAVRTVLAGRDGDKILQIKAMSVSDPNHGCRMIGAVQDISAERANLKKLQDAEERMRLAVLALHDVVWDWNIVENTIQWSNALHSHYGHHDLQAMADPRWGFERIHPRDRERVREKVMQFLQGDGQTWQDEYKFEREDGSYVDVRSRGYLIRDHDGRPLRMVGAMLDQSDQKSAERHLQQLNLVLESRVAKRTAELHRMWDTSADLMLVTGLDGLIRRANPSWTAVLGYDVKDVIGRHIFEFVCMDDQAMAGIVIEQAFSASVQVTEICHIHRDGSKRWIAWAAVGAGNEIFSTGRHITEAKAAAKALRQAEDALRQSQKVEAIGKLTGGVAHDFNNFLTVIRGATDMLRRTNLTETRRNQYLDAIAVTSERAINLTSQLLAFARRSALDPRTFCVVADLRDMEEVLRTLCGPTVEVSIGYEGDSCYVFADTNQFDTAIVNMAVNARDAMRGKGTFRLHVRPSSSIPACQMQPAVDGDFIAVSLTDSGVGIPTDSFERIFEPFYTTKEVGQGTGLGLSQVYGFAHQSGGAVRVENGPDRGAIFTLYLPRSYPTAGEIVENAPVEAVNDEQLRILIVEDHDDVGQLAHSVLEEFGHHAVLARNADEAQELLEQNPAGFDVVFSDVVMPNRNGVEFAKEVRRDYPEIAILLTSGYSDVLAEEGRHGFFLLKKPYSAGELADALRHVSRKSD